ncbi:hypothetical protein [Burkholderia vietnamiensis]|uniref:hypothetical protein n=1 Tax=Burkholderia vietnamiensis TaxID=60552 RepID=UPI001CAEF150|nr:hypothetical protein [Burkholderia vietnamiensis]CAG9229384.1 hypothetical protein BVI1335_70201 [Burkholderia vietnamiensis]
MNEQMRQELGEALTDALAGMIDKNAFDMHDSRNIDLILDKLAPVIDAKSPVPAGVFVKRSQFGPWVEIAESTDESVTLYAIPEVARGKLTKDQAEQLGVVTRCDPTFVLAYLEEGALYDVKLVAKVFELAKERAGTLLAYGGNA